MSTIAVRRTGLGAGDAAALDALLARIADAHPVIDDPGFLREAAVDAQALPLAWRRAVNDFRLCEDERIALVLSGFAVDEQRIGPTPSAWKPRNGSGYGAWREDAVLLLVASLLGDVFGWLTQQGGNFVHDIMPVRTHEAESIEGGSRRYLMWHTDDAYHDHRADYLLMICLRNPDRTPTTVGAPDMRSLDARHVEILFEPRFRLRPDPSHQAENRPAESAHGVDEATRLAYRLAAERAAAPPAVSVFSGDPATPFVRLDPDSMEAMPGDDEAAAALAALVENIDATLVDVALAPGEILIVDNHRVVHGRRPFVPRYDGHDRWLKRTGATRDLRRSRQARAHAGSRMLV